MKRWNRWDVFVPTKLPPPEHGIKLNQAGTTWWGKRWIEALESVLRAHAGRLARGRTYARAGRTHDLVIAHGKVTAKVTGSRDTPYDVRIELARFDQRTWSRAIAGMAAQAQFAAELLGGQMPQAIDEVFRAVGTSLFPEQKAELTTDCSCPDDGDPCKHIAATHYLLGEAFDRDPFLLFELRGRTKAEVLDALRDARAGAKPQNSRRRAAGPHPRNPPGIAEPTPEAPAVSLGELSALEFDAPRAALPALHFSFAAPENHGAVLRQLGSPTAWNGDASPADLLAPRVRAAAEAARRMALAEPPTEREEAPTAATTKTTTRKPSRARKRTR